MSILVVKEIYQEICRNNVEGFKMALNKYRKPFDKIIINKSTKTTLLHFLGNIHILKLCFFKIPLKFTKRGNEN